MNGRINLVRGLLLGVVLGATPAAAEIITAGKPAPAWSGKTVLGKPLASSSLKGKVVLLNFFSYYCGPCRKEYPHLQRFHTQYAKDGLTVVSVNDDDKLEEAAAFGKEVNATFPVVHDPKSAILKKFGVIGYPTNIVIGRDGKVKAVVESDKPEEIEAAFKKALAAR